MTDPDAVVVANFIQRTLYAACSNYSIYSEYYKIDEFLWAVTLYNG